MFSLFFSYLAIPSYPRNVVTLFVNQSSATIKWQPPTITGDQVFYEVECRRTCEIDGKDCIEEICGGDSNAGFVIRNKSYATTMTIPGTTGLLSPFVNYTCKIVAKNRVSEVAARKHKVEARSTTITFKTNGSGKSMALFNFDKTKSLGSSCNCYFFSFMTINWLKRE